MGVDVMKVILALSLAAALMVCFSEAKSAEASHILVASESQAADLKKQIDGGADFAELAKKHSTCPSGKSGGSLGEFGPGQMVKEFDTVVFNDEVGKVHGPVKTQ